jgi:hypothetical protein
MVNVAPGTSIVVKVNAEAPDGIAARVRTNAPTKNAPTSLEQKTLGEHRCWFHSFPSENFARRCKKNCGDQGLLFFLRAAAERKPHHQGENERLPNVAHDLPLSPTHGQGVYVGSSGLTSTPKQSLFPYGHAPGSVVLWCRLLPDPLSMMTS